MVGRGHRVQSGSPTVMPNQEGGVRADPREQHEQQGAENQPPRPVENASYAQCAHDQGCERQPEIGRVVLPPRTIVSGHSATLLLRRSAPVTRRPARDPGVCTIARTTGMVGRRPDSGMGRAFRPDSGRWSDEEWSADHRPRTRLKMKTARATMTSITRMVHNMVSSVPCLSQVKESGVQGWLRIPTPSRTCAEALSRYPTATKTSHPVRAARRRSGGLGWAKSGPGCPGARLRASIAAYSARVPPRYPGASPGSTRSGGRAGGRSPGVRGRAQFRRWRRTPGRRGEPWARRATSDVRLPGAVRCRRTDRQFPNGRSR
jgi:hypothetical protein